MKQQLWVVNSSLIGMLFIGALLNQMLRIEPPSVRRRRKRATRDVEQKLGESIPGSWEKIYKEDLFNTYVPTYAKPEKKSLVTPIPQQQQSAPIPPPELPKQEFVEPLGIVLKGIIISSDEHASVVMIEDETKKEGLYHLGDKIRDAQIIKISRNRVVFLRANGQQEVFFLRKDDPGLDSQSPERWQYIIRPGEENIFEIDPNNFKQEVESLGNFIERTAIVGTAYEQGKPVGVRIGNVAESDLAQQLGLQQNDVVKTVADTNVGDSKNRIKIFDKVTVLQPGATVKVKLDRAGQEVELTYNFVRIPKETKRVFTGEQSAQEGQQQGQDQKKKPAEPFKLSPTQRREKLVRDFKGRHPRGRNQKQAVAEIRKRLLRNLRSRLKNTRTRTK